MDRPLRVLHVITRLEPGGAQRNTLHTVATLGRPEFDVALAWGPGDPLDVEAAAIPDLRRFEIVDMVRPIHPLRDAMAMRRLRQAIHGFAPDVVHTHSSKAGILGRAAARLERVPSVVHSVHGWGFTPNHAPWKRRLFRFAERRAARWTDHFIAVSHANADEGRRLGIIQDGRVSVIRSGIDLGPFRKLPDPGPTRRRLDVPDGVPIVTQIGNFKPQKAPLDCVRAAAAVAANCPTAHFVMVGEGPLKAPAEALARELGVADRMRFPGWWDDVPGLLAATRVSVLTSRHEGLPRAVVESVAARVPVVATAVDGTPEVVRDGHTGFLVEPGDVAAVSRAVERLIRDDALHATLSRSERDLAEWDIHAMVRRQEELYRWLAPCPTP
jgi:glycosyltransferase involved in cell wall biosynthesis